VGALSANGQAALVTQATVGAQVNQALDVHGDFLAQLTFDGVLTLDDVTETGNLDLGEILNPNLGFNLCASEDKTGSVPSNPENVGQRNINALVAWKVHALNTSHLVLS
jgi:hypothetical protein